MKTSGAHPGTKHACSSPHQQDSQRASCCRHETVPLHTGSAGYNRHAADPLALLETKRSKHILFRYERGTELEKTLFIFTGQSNFLSSQLPRRSL